MRDFVFCFEMIFSFILHLFKNGPVAQLDRATAF